MSCIFFFIFAHMEKVSIKNGLYALSPAFVLLGVYLMGAVIAGDFYKVPFCVPFTVAAVYAVCILKGSVHQRISVFSEGAADNNIMYMLWIFVLAGIFASLAKSMGAVDATVSLTLKYVPQQILPLGIFLMSCFISFAIGTSVGTIVALMPIVSGLASELSCGAEWMAAIVVGGAFFGDNLSFISDTTIASTQSQGCSMKDKFRTNFLLVLPAAVIAVLIYLFAYQSNANIDIPSNIELLKTAPYIAVIVFALCGLNVLVTLVIGIIFTVATGAWYGQTDIIDIFQAAGQGVSSMSELIVVTLLAGGIMNVIRYRGGLEFIIEMISRKISGRRAAESAIASVTVLTNICTANNTIAIITAGPVAKKIAGSFGISAKRSASIMDTSSCCVQGLIPYGIQIMMAAGMIGASPIALLPYLYYPMLLGVMVVISIVFKRNVR